MPAYRAQLALLIDDREQVKAAIDRSLAIDPDDPTALEARANYKAGIESDLEGALADLDRAVAIAPGATHDLECDGRLLQSARDAEREAEAAFKRSIELDPNDPVSYANLAILYLDQDRVKEAKVLIDKAMASIRPSTSRSSRAAATTCRPARPTRRCRICWPAPPPIRPMRRHFCCLPADITRAASASLPSRRSRTPIVSIPTIPVTSSFETAIAIDDYDSDRAIESAQETLKRARARGGDYASLSANRDAGSLLNEAFRLQGLDAWGRYYGDVTFDPFSGGGYVDQALAGSVDLFVVDLGAGTLPVDPEGNASSFSSLFQGLMFDPLMLSGRSRTANLFRRPFVEGSLGGGFINNGTGDWGWSAEAEVQGYLPTPIPWAFYGQFSADRSDDFRTHTEEGFIDPTSQFNLEFKNVVGTGYITAKPTPDDRVVAYVNANQESSRPA